MTDVLKIALDRRAELHEEVAKLDEFIRMAEMLIRRSQQRTTSVDDNDNEAMPRRPARVAEPVSDEAEPQSQLRRSNDDDVNVQISRPQVIRRTPMTGGQIAG